MLKKHIFYLLTPAIQLAESSRTAGGGSQLVLGVLYMLGACSRAKIECFEMHIRPKVRTFATIRDRVVGADLQCGG